MTPAVSDEVAGRPNPRATGPGRYRGNRRGRKGDLSGPRNESGGREGPPLPTVGSEAQFPVALATSTETPGPIVDEIETFFM
jgi:hypothetical protein